MISRRAALAVAGAAAVARPARAAPPLRVGYQKNGSFVILRKDGTLDAAVGSPVRWAEFTAGPPIMEALNAGEIDVASVGDTPPIFAQAAGIDVVYVGAQPLGGENQAILVRDGSPVRTVADLRGKRVAFTRGSSAHNLVIRALAKAGMSPADIQAVPLQPADAGAAFRAGSLDAWAIWDPFLALAQADGQTRVLAWGREVALTANFIVARRAWADAQPDQVRVVLDAINRAGAWAEGHGEELAALMSSVTGVPIAVQRVAAPRGVYAVQPMDDAIIAGQQGIADAFAALRVIPNRVEIRKAVWDSAVRAG